MWSASLRYLFSLPMLAVLAWRRAAGRCSAWPLRKHSDLVGFGVRLVLGFL